MHQADTPLACDRYLDVPEVRTRDDALITVKVMLFYELADVEVMLQNTADPIAEVSG